MCACKYTMLFTNDLQLDSALHPFPNFRAACAAEIKQHIGVYRRGSCHCLAVKAHYRSPPQAMLCPRVLCHGRNSKRAPSWVQFSLCLSITCESRVLSLAGAGQVFPGLKSVPSTLLYWPVSSVGSIFRWTIEELRLWQFRLDPAASWHLLYSDSHWIDCPCIDIQDFWCEFSHWEFHPRNERLLELRPWKYTLNV